MGNFPQFFVPQKAAFEAISTKSLGAGQWLAPKLFDIARTLSLFRSPRLFLYYTAFPIFGQLNQRFPSAQGSPRR